MSIVLLCRASYSRLQRYAFFLTYTTYAHILIMHKPLCCPYNFRIPLPIDHIESLRIYRERTLCITHCPLSVLFAEGLCADARVDTEVFAETACRGKIHTESNLFDALVGGEQTLFNLANGNLVDDVRGCLFCHLIADIGQVFGTNSHLVGIPRYGVAGGAIILQYAHKLRE